MAFFEELEELDKEIKLNSELKEFLIRAYKTHYVCSIILDTRCNGENLDRMNEQLPAVRVFMHKQGLAPGEGQRIVVINDCTYERVTLVSRCPSGHFHGYH